MSRLGNVNVLPLGLAFYLPIVSDVLPFRHRQLCVRALCIFTLVARDITSHVSSTNIALVDGAVCGPAIYLGW